MNNGQTRSKPVLPVADAFDEVLTVVHRLLPDPDADEFKEDLANFVGVVVQVFPWRRRRGTTTRQWFASFSGAGPVPIEEAPIYELAQVARQPIRSRRGLARSRELAAREHAVNSLREVQKVIFEVMSRVAGAAGGGAEVWKSRAPLRFRLTRQHRLELDADWLDLVGYHALQLCREVRFERIRRCPQCGRIFVRRRLDRRVWCSSGCGTKHRLQRRAVRQQT